MKLRNKKTGEIGNLVLNINPNRESYSVLSTEDGDTICGNLVLDDYDSLAELNAEWEDYEEDEYYWAITGIKYDDGITKMKNKHKDMTAFDKSIGNYFETEEEAERAVEKLKAWKRLKDKGFRFTGVDYNSISFVFEERVLKKGEVFNPQKDLNLLFGGEE